MSTPMERFWGMVERADDTACFEWRGHVRGTGALQYGGFEVDHKRFSAHRWIYEQLIGPIPEGLELDHLCGNSICVNPAHLEPVTRLENVRRSSSPAGINARKTHCHRGHPFDEANTIWTRRCRCCRSIQNRATHAVQRARRLAATHIGEAA